MSRLRPRTGSVSAREVAARAGVSRSAVSRTFTPGASVSETTRRRVLEAAEALGYQVNQLARGLMRNESGIVCLIGADIATPYRSALLSTLTQHLQNAGKVAMVVNTDRSDGGVDLALQQAVRYRAEASVVLSGMPDRSIVRLCHDHGQKLVLINRDDEQEGPLRINLDEQAAGRAVLAAFLRAGCRRLAFANSGAGTPSLMAREAGFVAAAAAMGLNVVVERIGATAYESGLRLARRMLARAERPDAVFCVSDLVACGFMDAARNEFGLRVPEELCIAGFDNIEQAGWSSYRLTTFAQPVEEIASRAVAWLEEQPAPSRIRLPAEMIWRSTIRGRA